MVSKEQTEGRLIIDDLVLDTRTHEVWRGDSLLKLPKLSYRTLLCLAEAAPAVVSQDELIAQVWNGRVVSPETVTQRIKLLRSAIGDDAQEPRYVALVRGEGYRLLATVVAASAEAASSPSDRTRTAGLYAAAVAIAAVSAWWLLGENSARDAAERVRPILANSVAVLPFEESGVEPDDRYLSETLANTLIDQLDDVSTLNVLARSSAESFNTRDLDYREAAGRLGVESLVDGQVSQEGDEFTIAVALIDGETGSERWADEFPGDRSTLPLIQQQIAERLISELAPDYVGAATDAWLLDPDAYNVRALAEKKYHDVREQPIVNYQLLNEAIALYQRLVQLTPDSATAHARLAEAIMYGGETEPAKQSVERAIALDPDSAEAQYALGLFKWMRYEDGSGDAFRRAVELNPNYPLANEAYAKHIWHQLISDEPEIYFRRALDFEPQSLSRYADLIIYYGMSGKREQAIETANQTAAYFGDNASAWMLVARAYELAGDIDEAIAWAIRANVLEPERQETAWLVAELYARIGDFEAARRYEPEAAFNLLYWERRYDEMIEFGEELIFEPVQPQLWYGLGRAYAAIDRYDMAIRYLQRQDLPFRAISENRRANDEEAMVTLADALKESGNEARARELAEWFKPYLQTMINTGGERFWWPHLYLACVNSILDDREAALASVEQLEQTVGIPWYPLLVDAPCFERLNTSPRYQQVIESIEARKAEIRERLPATFARRRAEWGLEGEESPFRVRTAGSAQD